MTKINWSLQHKRDTAANWANDNPILLPGQFGIETDTNKLKLGNGSNWNITPYFTTPGSVSWGSITGDLLNQDDLVTYIGTNLGVGYTETAASVFDFSENTVIGSISIPITGNLTKGPVQICGIINILIHQSMTEPTYPSGFVKESGNYLPGSINIIRCQAISSINDDVIYSITQI